MLSMYAVSVVIVTVVQFINAADSCQTPNGQNGNCVTINHCPPLFSLFEKGLESLSSSTGNYLKKSMCGFEGNYPKVCCSIGSSTPPNESLLIADSVLLPNSSFCGISTTKKIVGGEKTELDEFPWMALLQFQLGNGQKAFLCGGSLINNRYVLTAAHCIVPNLIGVQLGDYNTETDIDCIVNKYGRECAPKHVYFGIEKKIPYTSYEPKDTNKYHDIGLLRLDREVVYSEFIKPICLPLSTDEITKSYIGQNLTVAGWGSTERGVSSSIKLKVNVPVTELSVCEVGYKKLWNAPLQLDVGQICAGGEKGKDSCRGDSGGPLMTVKVDKNQDARHYIIGLVSFGPIPCGLENLPGVYTKIAKYVKWIVDQLEP